MIKSTASSQRSKFCKPLVILAALPRCSLVSRGRARASVRKWHALCAISKFASGQRHTVALPRKHLLTLFPQNSLRDFCGSPGSLMRFLWEPSSRRSKFRKPLVILAALLRCSLVSRGRARASVRKFPHYGKLTSSQAAKSPPGSSQECACSPSSHKSFAAQNLCGNPITPSVTAPKQASDAATAPRRGA